MELRVPLEGLYLHLVRSGFPLSVRDYEDALTALGCGYGLHRRDDLRWLCEALWARTDQELSRLERLFREFPWPSPEEIRKLTGDSAREEETSHPRPSDTRAKSGQSARSQPAEQAPAVEFAAPTQSGVGLPRAQVPRETGDMFIFTPRPLIGLRSLIIAWRRFRLAQRSGPRVELDIDASIVEQARRGTLVEPVLVPVRRNPG